MLPKQRLAAAFLEGNGSVRRGAAFCVLLAHLVILLCLCVPFAFAFGVMVSRLRWRERCVGNP